MKKSMFAMALSLFSGLAMAAELAGVEMPETATVGDTELVLNGMGLREKAWIDVYVGGLYLPENSDKAADIIESNGPSRMVMHFVRDVPADKVIDGWKDGFANNNSEELQQAIAERVEQFNAFFSSDLKEDDVIVLDYLPGSGTHVMINDEHMGTIEGQDFATALRAVWLGPKPPTRNFQKGLLGK